MMTPEKVATGLIEEAISNVRSEIAKVRTRAKLCGTKVKDILEVLEHLESAVKEMAELEPTKTLLDQILGYVQKIRPYIATLRDEVRKLEDIADKLEDLIP